MHSLLFKDEKERELWVQIKSELHLKYLISIGHTLATIDECRVVVNNQLIHDEQIIGSLRLSLEELILMNFEGYLVHLETQSQEWLSNQLG